MAAEIQDALRERWLRLMERAGARGEVETPWRELVAAYRSPDRHYHHLGHVADCLARLDEAEPLNIPVELAIWFHDVVYDSHRSDNELLSARWAEGVLGGLGIPELVIAEVRALILVTWHHQAATPAEELLVSIDLSILGRGREEYQAYAGAIRAEYGWVADAAYREGRARVLRKFLERAVIFPHPHFRARYETAARDNLTWELARLG